MNPFECCLKCVAPKRYPGCGSTCKEYQEAKKIHEAMKAQRRTIIKGENAVKAVLNSYRPTKGSKVSPWDKQW